MDNINKFNILYDNSNNIIKLYDKFVDLLVNKDVNAYIVLNEIRDEIDIEYSCYDNLDLNGIDDFMKMIHSKDEEELKFADIRVNSKLAILYDKLCGNTVLNLDMVTDIDENLNFSLVDLISSKITIDVYKLLDLKLDSICVGDNKSLCCVDKIRVLNIEYMVYKLSLNEVSERLGLKYCYDIKKIPVLDIDEIEKNVFESHGLNIDLKKDLNSKVFKYLLSKIYIFKEMNMNNDSYESIYDNLLYVSVFEVLLSYLNSNQLEFLLAYFSRIKSNNKIVLNNMKNLVRSKINEL